MAIIPPRRALILGSADTLAADRDAALELFKPDILIAANHAARDYDGHVDAFVSMHPELIPLWLGQRIKRGGSLPGDIWYPRHKPCSIARARPVKSWGGSSGLMCVAVAEQLGVTHAVLAGIPMVKMNRHYDKSEPWMECRQYYPAWERQRDHISPWVRSMSGWTRTLLGEPTREWLDADTTGQG